MELISKVDIEGTFEITDTLRAIGVSNTNLSPNDKGIVPLSNQNAMTIEKKASSIETGVITEKPIEVASPDALESLDFGAMIPEKKEEKTEDVVEEKSKEVAEEELKEEKVELPPSEPVQAQAPEVVPAGLFIDGTPEEEIKLVNPMDETANKVSEPSIKEEPPKVEAPKEDKPIETKTEEIPVMSSNTENSNDVQKKTEDVNVKEQPSKVEKATKEIADEYQFKTGEDVEKYVNTLIDEMEKKHQEELKIFRDNVVKTCKFLFENKNTFKEEKVEKVTEEQTEMIDAIPSLEKESLPKVEPETAQDIVGSLDIPVLNENQNSRNEISNVDNEEIKPKFVL